jgi:hypothetical protein
MPLWHEIIPKRTATRRALTNSTSAPSPMSLTIRPEWAAIAGSIRSRQIAFNRFNVPASWIPIRREYPTTSAERIAASRLWRRPPPCRALPWVIRRRRHYGSSCKVSIGVVTSTEASTTGQRLTPTGRLEKRTSRRHHETSQFEPSRKIAHVAELTFSLSFHGIDVPFAGNTLQRSVAAVTKT